MLPGSFCGQNWTHTHTSEFSLIITPIQEHHGIHYSFLSLGTYTSILWQWDILILNIRISVNRLSPHWGHRSTVTPPQCRHLPRPSHTLTLPAWLLLSVSSHHALLQLRAAPPPHQCVIKLLSASAEFFRKESSKWTIFFKLNVFSTKELKPRCPRFHKNVSNNDSQITIAHSPANVQLNNLIYFRVFHWVDKGVCCWVNTSVLSLFYESTCTHIIEQESPGSI